MSYRELRNFTEMLRSLGYPQAVSMEAFRNPNFVLVADILSWLVQRYDPRADFSDEISTERDRIAFLRSVAQLMYTKARIKLNTKRLYMADGYAVKELIKIASVLYQAMQTQGEDEYDAGPTEAELNRVDTFVSRTRQLASNITSDGAALHDLLGKEQDLRQKRNAAMSRQVNPDDMKREVEAAISELKRKTTQLEEALANLDEDEQNLTRNIEQRRHQLDRDAKHLSNLAHVRPAFMDEYERLEEELSRRYEVFIERFRNLAFLESQLHELKEAERQQLRESEAKLKELRERIRNDDLNELRSDAFGGFDSDEDEFGGLDDEPLLGLDRPRGARPGEASSGRTRPGGAGSNGGGGGGGFTGRDDSEFGGGAAVRVVGSMRPEESESDPDDDF